MSKSNVRRKGGGNSVRIIGGRWRGRKLQFADVPGLRPSPDRVRETLFNWLLPLLPDSRCLDLFAGSGALGFEAASRGAAKVVCVDADARVAQALRTQAGVLGGDMLEIIAADANTFLASTSTSFDVVFLDPPFGQGLLGPVAESLETGGWLAADARVYIECERALNAESLGAVLPANWRLLRTKQAGQVAYHLAAREAAG